MQTVWRLRVEATSFDVRERGLQVEEVNAVDVVQKFVEITVDLGAAKSVWPIRKKGVTRTQATKTVRLAAACGSPIHVEGDARLELVGTARSAT